jgi:protein TonB
MPPHRFGLGASLALHGLVAALLILWPVAETPPQRIAEPEGLAIIYEGVQEGEGDAIPPAPPEVATAPPIPDIPPPPPMLAAPAPPPPPPPVLAVEPPPAPPPPLPAPPPIAMAEPLIPVPPPPVVEPPAPQLVEAPPPREEPRPPAPPQQMTEAPPPQSPPPERRAPSRQSSLQASASPVRLNAALQGRESFTLEGQTSAPEPLDTTRNRRPNYPEASRRRGEQGIVRLELRVDAAGRVVDVLLLETSGFNALDTAALNAVRDWRFRPAERAGVPVAARIIHSVQFRLETARR